MGLFIAHLVPGLAFTFLGLWHLINTINSYRLKGQANFTSTTWYPLSTIKHLELYLIVFFSLLSIAVDFLDHPNSTSVGLDGLLHATMFFQLTIYAVAALAANLMPTSSDAHVSLVGVLAAAIFAQELFLLHFHSVNQGGLEGYYHWLLQLLVAACFLASAATTCFPTSFAAALVRSAAVMLQGLWFVDMAFALWFPRFVAQGCYRTGWQKSVVCETKEASRRAGAIANLQFSWVVAGVSIFTTLLCLRPDWKGREYKHLQYWGAQIGQVSGEEKELKECHVAV